jgi:serine/threonine protein kinase
MEKEYTDRENESFDGEESGQSKVIDANKIPKPVPAGSDADMQPSEAPLTEDTIAIKKPVSSPKTEKPITFDEDSSEKKTEPEGEPERRLKIFCYNCAQKLDLTDMEPFSKIDCPSCNEKIIIPKWWDNYLLEESCGIGGMAKVFRGLDLALDREVAIKILNNDICDDESRSKLFLHEARTAATLNHYAILPIYTCGEFENQAYFVMQYMGGGSLDQELERDEDHPLTISESMKWLKDICEALDNARRHGIIHHDIKPGNFMLDDDRNVKIGDFGISQALHDSRSEEMTELTKQWGSPDYVSPEKILNGKESYLGDIYSLGATFYHLLTKETPFDNHDVESMLKAKTLKDPIDIRKLRDDIPEHIAKLIMSMMDRTPEVRPTYRDIIAELNAIKKSSSSGQGGRRRSSAPKPKPASGSVSPAPKAPVKIGKPAMENFDPSKYGVKKQNKVVSLIKAIVVICLIGFGLNYLFSHGYIDKFKAMVFGVDKVDYFPSITQMISKGEVVKAAQLAEKKLGLSQSTEGGMKQAAIQLAVCSYMKNDEDVYRKCATISERLLSAGVSDKAPELALLKYLSRKKVPSIILRKQLAESPELALVGEVAVFAKETYQNGNKSERRVALKKYAEMVAGVPEKYWGLGWGDRIQLWYNWTVSKKGDINALEPVFRRTKSGLILMQETSSKSELQPISLKLSDLTVEWLESHRGFAEGRPKPEDFSFPDELISPYLNGLSDKYKAQEKKRVKLLSTTKVQLCKMMLLRPYKGSLKLKGDKTVKGTIIANTRGLIVRSKDGKVKVQWGDLPVSQIVRLLAFYAKKSKGINAKNAVGCYLRIAVISDWYGQYKNTVTAVNKAMELDHSAEPEFLEYMFR